MKNSILRKNLYQSIFRSVGRYIAIAVIIALGAGMFVGLRSTRNDMVATGQVYTDRQNMFDLRFLTSYGWDKEQLDQIQKIDGLADVEGLFYMDLIVNSDKDGSDSVYRFYSLPEKMNVPVLLGGRMPERADECLADGYHNNDKILGTTITVSEANDEDSLEKIRYRTFTVVGYVSTPLYMDMTRGNTSVGNGSISSYFYVPDNAFDVDYYTEIHATIPGDYKIYSDTYNDAMSDAADEIEPYLIPLAKDRLKTVKREAEAEYKDGIKEFQDGLKEYQNGKKEAERELQDAYQELIDGQDELRRNAFQLEKSEQQIKDGKQAIVDGRKTLADALKKMADEKVNALTKVSTQSIELGRQYQDAAVKVQDVDTRLAPVSAERLQAEIEVGIAQARIAPEESVKTSEIEIQAGLLSAIDAQIDSLLAQLEIEKIKPEPDQVQIENINNQLSEKNTEKQEIQGRINQLNAELEAIRQPVREAEANLTEKQAAENALLAERKAYQNTLDSIQSSIVSLASEQVAMELQFSAAEKQMNAAQAQLDASESQLEKFTQDIEDGWNALEDGKKEWNRGYKEYKKAKTEVWQELADAEADLAEAREKLADARKTIDDMVKNDVIILDRNSNMGYTSLDSSSNIVAGVSKVFPVFFLLVAALVCITTMTRMVDEERTQIGTLKALGYSNWAIISKYLIYAGSSAVLGCTIGVILGSVAFPVILWEAYKIMIFITPRITLQVDWPLCITVVLTYTAVMLFVTWDCCRKALKEVPAELIRPKAPTTGKQLIFEKYQFWNKISFLNKVAIRNIFRYRQRLAMMMLGIGGCAGLLLTGFGLRDSIMNIVDIQFEEVTVYDMEVYFRSGRTEDEQLSFQQALAPYADRILFFNQSSAELDSDTITKDISVLTAPEDVSEFIDFHSGKNQLAYPGINEVLLSSGMADMLGLKTGDELTLRNLDMEVMNLKISGVYDNHVYNYAIISPNTMESQWGRHPENQMAFVNVKDDLDVYSVGAIINGMDGVMNVSISDELADMVGNMMKALNLVVMVVVVCAGLLAAIVLYNLTNININERIREIATIKVLGFNAVETAMYVFKENLVLSVFGSAFGMVLGKLLLGFVISQVKIDMIWLEPRLQLISYVMSILMTLFMAVLVDFIFYFRLDRINMAEALKSVE